MKVNVPNGQTNHPFRSVCVRWIDILNTEVYIAVTKIKQSFSYHKRNIVSMLIGFGCTAKLPIYAFFTGAFSRNMERSLYFVSFIRHVQRQWQLDSTCLHGLQLFAIYQMGMLLEKVFFTMLLREI